MAALGTRKLTLTVNAVDVTAQVASCAIAAAEAKTDFVSFADAAAGGSRQYTLKLKFVQDPSTGSLWDEVWTMAGTDVPVVIHPAGGATPSPSNPAFNGTVTITEPDGDILGGDADVSNTQRWVTQVEWAFTAKPTRVTS